MGEPVRRADDERVEVVLLVQTFDAGLFGDLHRGLGALPSRSTRTERSMRRSCPVASRTAASMRPRKWLSIHSREVVRHRERERLVRKVETLRLREPGAIGLVVEGGSQTLRNLGPQTLCSEQLLPFHAGWSFLLALPERREHSSVRAGSKASASAPIAQSYRICRSFQAFPSELHRCGKRRNSSCIHWGKRVTRRTFPPGVLPVQAVEKLIRDCLSILARRPPGAPQLHPHWTRETDLSAQRASTEAEARLPAADVFEGRPRHPEAAARARPEAPLRLAGDAPQPCNAATVSPARATSTPSTGKAGRSRRATSSSTGSTGKVTRTVTCASGSRSPRRSAAR